MTDEESDIFTPMSELRYKGRTLWMMSPYTSANYSEKAILTKSTFNFVDAWLLKKKIAGEITDEPLYYWRQAKNYYVESIDVKSEVKPLLNYYCCLNTVKCLISKNGIQVSNITHGVGRQKATGTKLEDQIIDFLGTGALKLLRTHLGSDGGEGTYSLKSILYNIVAIHRAYTYTYPADRELFIPLKSLKYYKKDGLDRITVTLDINKPGDLSQLNNIPSSFTLTTKTKEDWDKICGESSAERLRWAIAENKLYFRYKGEVEWTETSGEDDKVDALANLHKKTRPYFQYISADTPLWYLKISDNSNKDILNYSSLVLSYAAMHCLSEMVRYVPDTYAKLLDSECAWLITEFIEVGMDQFIDEIASEITGLNIMRSGVKGKC